MNKQLYRRMNWPEIESVLYSDGDRPGDLLGAHQEGSGVLIQAFIPDASGVSVILADKARKIPMELADEDGFYACYLPGVKAGSLRFSYEVTDRTGRTRTEEDCYRFPSLFTNEDEKRFAEGIHYELWQKLGAHPMTLDGAEGTAFAVWAPGCTRVSVVGEFDCWDGRVHQMNRTGQTDVFELFIPGVHAGALYQYELRGRRGDTVRRSDPFALRTGPSPLCASVVEAPPESGAGNAAHLPDREARRRRGTPFSVYEFDMASFGDFQTAAADLPERVKALGFTAVEFRPSDRGSNSLFAPDWRYGTPEELRALTAAFHEKGLEVIFRWDPSRFDRSASGLQQFGLAPTYESADPLRSDTPDGKALYFDLGNKRVSNYLLCAALYYVEQLHADGLFFDDLSPMLYLDYDRQESGYTPNLYGGVENLDAVEFLKHLHSILQKRDAGAVSIAQLSSAWTSVTGRVEDDTLGFTFLMHGGWLQAHRQYLSCDPLFRRGAHNLLLEDLLYQYMENYILPLPDSAAGPGMSALLGGFHGDEKARLSALRLFLSLMMVHPGAKLMNLGETHRSLAGGEGRGELAPVDRMVKDLHALYRAQPALHQNDTRPDSFEWIRQMANDHCVLCALRRGSRPAEFLIIAVNGSGSDWQEEIGVPYAGGYQEIFNSEAKAYGGGAAVPRAARRASEKETDGRAYTVQLSLPASSVTIYQYV